MGDLSILACFPFKLANKNWVLPCKMSPSFKFNSRLNFVVVMGIRDQLQMRQKPDKGFLLLHGISELLNLSPFPSPLAHHAQIQCDKLKCTSKCAQC